MTKSIIAVLSAIACQAALAGSDPATDNLQASFARMLNPSASPSHVQPVTQAPDVVMRLVNERLWSTSTSVAGKQQQLDSYGANLIASFDRMLSSGHTIPQSTAAVRGERDAVEQMIAGIVRGDRTALGLLSAQLAYAASTRSR
jgi:hypothetical protein